MNKDKPYSPPKIIFETDLETKAGTPVGINDTDLLFPGIEE